MPTNPHEFQSYLDAPEGSQFESKEAKGGFHFDKLVEYVVAIANGGGGRMLLGVTDKRPRQVVGTQAFAEPGRAEAGLDFSAGICAKATLGDLDPAAIADFRVRWAKKAQNDRILNCSDQQTLADAELALDGQAIQSPIAATTVLLLPGLPPGPKHTAKLKPIIRSCVVNVEKTFSSLPERAGCFWRIPIRTIPTVSRQERLTKSVNLMACVHSPHRMRVWIGFEITQPRSSLPTISAM